MPTTQTRRRFLAALASAGAAGLAQVPPAFGEEGVLETTTVRLQTPALCVSPLYIAEELLRAEGFTDIRYTAPPDSATILPIHGDVDFSPAYASDCVRAIDAGEPLMLLAGVMVGCFELFGNEGIRNITDPKGKPKELFERGKIDAFLAFPPEPQELRARGIGHVIVNTAVDRPWSQYFCCMLAGNRES